MGATSAGLIALAAAIWWSGNHVSVVDGGGGIESMRGREVVTAKENETLDDLVRIIAGREGSLQEVYDAEQRLAAFDESREAKSEGALKVVEARAREHLRDSRIVSLLTEDALARLRGLVRESGDEPASFHMGAASALAHLGDVESLAMLRAKGEAVRRANDSPVGSVGDIVWCIEIQHPPEKLLEFLSDPSADELSDPRHVTEGHARAWAVRRAMEIGLERERVRASVFAYVEKVRGLAASTDRDRWMRDYLLSEAKRVAVAEGALEESELAWIKAPPTARMEH